MRVRRVSGKVIFLSVIGCALVKTFDSNSFSFIKLVFNVLSYSLLYAVPMYAVLCVSLRALKSRKAFFIMSVLLAIVPTILAAISNNNSTANHSIDNVAILADGQLTLAGILYYLISPFLLLILFAVYELSIKDEGELQ